jgi:plastocyanin
VAALKSYSHALAGWLARLAFCLCLGGALRAAEFTCTITSAKGGDPVIEATVALVPLDHPAPPVTPGAQVEIAQEGQEFYGFVTIVQAGTKVVFPNRDTVQHHVYSLSKARKFELPLYNPGAAESLVFETTGLVTLGCNIHDWMVAHLVVVPTPWFSKSDTEGRLKITAPAGRYRMELWHPRLGTATTEEVTLTEGQPLARSFSLTLKPDRRIRRGGGSKSGGY